jgi:hypothetical protein
MILLKILTEKSMVLETDGETIFSNWIGKVSTMLKANLKLIQIFTYALVEIIKENYKPRK